MSIELWVFLYCFLTTFMFFLFCYSKLKHKKRLKEEFFTKTIKGSLVQVNEKSTLYKKAEKIIKRTRKKITVKQFFMLSGFCGLICGFIAYLATEFLGAVLLGIVGGSYIPYAYLQKIIDKKKREIANQFSPMLKHMSNYLRAGNNLRQAIEKTTLSTDGELGHLLEKIVKVLNGGGTLNSALELADKETELIEFKMFHILISIHNDMGGDLANSLDNLAGVIHEKKGLRVEIDEITRETKTSAYITAVVPTIMYMVLRGASPDYIQQLEKMPFGKIGLMFSFIFIILGVVIVRKTSDIKVDKAYR